MPMIAGKLTMNDFFTSYLLILGGIWGNIKYYNSESKLKYINYLIWWIGGKFILYGDIRLFNFFCSNQY